MAHTFLMIKAQHATSTTIDTNNEVKYQGLTPPFTSLGIKHYDKPIASETLHDCIDARRAGEVDRLFPHGHAER